MKNIFDNQNICITGSDGFIGSHLVQELVQLGANVKAVVNYNSWNSIGWLSCLNDDELNSIEIVFADVRDDFRMMQVVDGSAYVFHLSSLVAIPYSYVAPKSYFDTNVNGALNVLQACKENKKLKRMLHVSKSEVYGSAQYVPIDEQHPLVGQSPYSASKIAADKAVESYFLSFGLPVITARPFNTYGPRQTARAVIPNIISQALTSSHVKLGNTSPTRDFNYVTDTVKGMLKLICLDDADGEVFNIGSGNEYSIGAILKIVEKLTGCSATIENHSDRVRPINSEVNRLLADNSKICKSCDWKSDIDIEEGLQLTINWIKDNLSLFQPHKYNI